MSAATKGCPHGFEPGWCEECKWTKRLATSQSDVTRLAAELAESVRALAVSQGEVEGVELAADRLLDDLDRARALLREFEWYPDGTDETADWSCNYCGAFKHEGHATGCRLAAFLPALATPTTTPEPDRASPEVTVKENADHER